MEGLPRDFKMTQTWNQQSLFSKNAAERKLHWVNLIQRNEISTDCQVNNISYIVI